MTIADHFINKGKREGKIEGKLEGKIEVATRLLSKYPELPDLTIAEITGLKAEQISELREVLKAGKGKKTNGNS